MANNGMTSNSSCGFLVGQLRNRRECPCDVWRVRVPIDLLMVILPPCLSREPSYCFPFLRFGTPRWPSYLDNTVAGGITAGDTPYASILRECAEEASLDPQIVEDRIRFGSVVVYHYRTAQGWIQPEVQYVYDLDLTPEFGALLEAESPEEVEERERDRVRPRTNAADGEVESFELMDLESVVARICDHEFKPNCALVSLVPAVDSNRASIPKLTLARARAHAFSPW